MELDDLEHSAPPLTPCAPPSLRPARSPIEVFDNINALLSFLLSLPIYRHLYSHLSSSRSDKKSEWMQELGDWRKWTIVDVLTRLRKFWYDGAIVDYCRNGLEKSASLDELTTVLGAPIKSRSSRWAAVATPAPVLSMTKTQQPSTTDARLRALLEMLPVLEASFLSRAAMAKFAPIRIEVVLDQCMQLIEAVYGTNSEAKALASRWADEFASIGINLDRSTFI